MKYIFTLLLVFIISFGFTSSTIADNADFSASEFVGISIEECTLTVKTSFWWSIKSDEFTYKGDCDRILKAI